MVMYMTTLDPNKTYIYERVDDKIYAREMGSASRILISIDISDHGSYGEDRNLWMEILVFARTNNILQQELDRVIMLYYLLKKEHNIKNGQA